jgi:arylsulfatase A-like enzyme
LKTKINEYGDPFFAFINFNSAHIPYHPPKQFEERFLNQFDRWDEVDEELGRALADDAGDAYIMGNLEPGDAEWELSRYLYDAEIAYMDSLLEDLFNFLKLRDLMDDTMVIVTSDHGEHFGEHGLAYHKFALTEELVNVPLVVNYPANSEQGVSDELVSLVDLVPTIADIADISLEFETDGRSLRSDSEPDVVFAETGRPNTSQRSRMLKQGSEETFKQFDRGLQMVRSNNYKLVRDTEGNRSLYDLTDGEKEIHNENVIEQLEVRLEEVLQPQPTGETEEDLDEHVEQHLRDMGYMG